MRDPNPFIEADLLRAELEAMRERARKAEAQRDGAVAMADERLTRMVQAQTDAARLREEARAFRDGEIISSGIARLVDEQTVALIEKAKRYRAERDEAVRDHEEVIARLSRSQEQAARLREVLREQLAAHACAGLRIVGGCKACEATRAALGEGT